MSKVIRIGTRDSQLAMWQAKTVQHQLEHLGYQTTIVPVKSTGDLVLNKPLYEMGITGIFTKTLDVAMLNGDIDVAVHSLKDVPTSLPKGIVQGAVLKRGNTRDMLVFKNNEEFLSQKDAVIATGSLRRRAQWLNRYPTHTVVDLRGNVNLRLQKLEDNQDWNAAVFAAAGLGRLGIKPENSFNLDWMIPAPAQGAIMVAALEADESTRAILAEINDEHTQICTQMERDFLRLLEGGCSAPIGAVAFVKDDEILFKGVLLSLDGSKRIDVTRTEKIGNHHYVAEFCANYIIERGGKRLMDEIKKHDKDIDVYATKSLSELQLQQFSNHLKVKCDDAIKINFNRLAPKVLKSPIKNVVITSQNAVDAILNSVASEELNFKNIYCVGRRTKKLIEQKIGPVKHSANNAKALADYMVEYLEGTEVTYFCSDIRLDELPQILTENNIKVTEIEAYQTKLDAAKISNAVKGVMFFSPSTVESFIKQNKPTGIAFCIGETTAKEAKKYFSEVKIAKIPSVESVIDLVNQNL